MRHGKIQMDFLASQKVSNGYGRLETRILTTSEMLNPYSTWPGLAQVYRLERQFQWWRSGRCYRTSNEVEFGITSLSRSNASPARLLMIRRAHWGIETGLHGRRDVTFKEDTTRMTMGDTGKVMTSMNNLVIASLDKQNSKIPLTPNAGLLLISLRRFHCSPHPFPDFGKTMVLTNEWLPKFS